MEKNRLQKEREEIGIFGDKGLKREKNLAEQPEEE